MDLLETGSLGDGETVALSSLKGVPGPEEWPWLAVVDR